MNWIVVLPLVTPLLAAILCFLAWPFLKAQRFISVAGTAASIILAIVLFSKVNQLGFVKMQIGSWSAPYGITIIADRLSAIMVMLTAIIGFTVVIYSLADVDKIKSKGGFYPAFCILLAGLNGAFLTGDLFNLYVWFEVILIASFVLLALGSRKLQLESAVKYAVLNLVATSLLLVAIALIYGISGTLNMADLSSYLLTSRHVGLITTIAVVFIVALGMKAALFPLFFWLPAAYHTPSFSTSAIFAALLSKVGVYALIRLFTLIFLRTNEYTYTIILLLALYTLIIGIIGAIVQKELRRVFSFTLISHIGFMIVGIALMTPLALIGSIFYLAQHVLIMCSLFMACGIIFRLSATTEPKKCGGLYQSAPLFALLFFVCIFSLAGIPPLSGFWPKLILIKASIASHNYTLAVVILVTSLLTLYVMTMLWQSIFLKPAPGHKKANPFSELALSQQISLIAPMIILTALALIIGLFPNLLYHVASTTAYQLLHPAEYVSAVLTG